jgi:hypothetical protein
MNRQHLAVLLLLPISGFGLGYAVAPKEQLDHEVQQSGFLQTDTSRIISATVESLRDEKKMLVFSYKGTVKVHVERKMWFVLGGHQELIVPGVVPYYLDLSALSLSDVTYDEKSKILTVAVPKLSLGDIAFQPEDATTVNGGVLTFSDDVVAELAKTNYKQARRAFTAQAQGRILVEAAKKQAIGNIQSYFEIPLRITGHPEIRVVARFK